MDHKLIVEAVFRMMVKNKPLDVVTLSQEVKEVCAIKDIKQDRVTKHIVDLFDKYGASGIYIKES